MEAEYNLADWHNSTLLEKAATHLRSQPEYVKMCPEAKGEMISFFHAVRRELMTVQECQGLLKPRALHALRLRLNLAIDTDDFLRYRVRVFGYTFTIIMGIPEGV